MNTWPAHEAQHHGERRDDREEQGKPHWPPPHGGQGLKGSDASRKPYEREECVHGPNEAALLAGCEKAGQHRSGRAIEDIGIVEACREVGEDAKERNCATGQAEPPKSDDGARSHGALSAVRLTDRA